MSDRPNGVPPAAAIGIGTNSPVWRNIGLRHDLDIILGRASEMFSAGGRPEANSIAADNGG
jgi:hypothetical protein